MNVLILPLPALVFFLCFPQFVVGSRRCKATRQYRYRIHAYISKRFIGGCPRDQATMVGVAIDSTIRRVFKTESIIHSSQNRLGHTPVSMRRMLLNDFDGNIDDSRGAETQSEERTIFFHEKEEIFDMVLLSDIDDQDQDQEEADGFDRDVRRQLGPDFEYRGGGRCRGCDYDDSDARRQRRILNNDQTWNWIKRNMEPILSQESSNRVNNRFRNARWHCLFGKSTEVRVRLRLI